LNTSTGLGVAAISLAFAFGQIAWGLTQPLAGAVADRMGASRVVLIGVGMIALGTFITPWMTSLPGLVFAIAVLGAAGSGMAGPSILMAACARLLPPSRQAMAMAVVNAGGSFGQFVMSPLAGVLIVALGWSQAMQALALVTLLALPCIWLLRAGETAARAGAAVGGATNPANGAAHPRLGARAALAQAWAVPSYRMLCAGFFVCGFHVAFLATHLPGVVASCGLPTQASAWALGVLGLFNIVGTLAMGWAMGRWRMKRLLSLVYAARGLAVLVFLLAPKTEPVVLVFAAFMGLTFLSTVPPTAGLVGKLFGTANMATLFGMVMLSHQVGGFLGAWLGGQIFDATGSYNWVWYADIALAVGAALVHWPIDEKPLQPKAALA
jgi:predicted MFS family arabinose efflux permease